MGLGHIDHAADLGDVRVPASAIAAVDRLRTKGEVHVWCWQLRQRTDPGDFDLLDEVERGRALRFRLPEDAAAFTRTRAGARRAVARLLGVRPDEVRIGRRVCPGCGDREHGPPAVVRPPVPLAVSLSRTSGRGVLAVGAGDWIGVDIEALRPVEFGELSEMVMAPEERAHLMALSEGPERTAVFHRCWTRKEAVVKAAGVGLLGMPLHRMDVRPAEARPVTVSHLHHGELTRWQVRDLDLGDDWAAALARPLDGSTLGPVIRHPEAD
ncbi:4'-phosphopantetheinyl transferase family protein [Streptomyces boninensis]|uniref:4'-phosphopantetheinyl transferase family protein n=1 Tax=Streptomyces boninensis TaxID=2039455 RepID=UPI003B228A59